MAAVGEVDNNTSTALTEAEVGAELGKNRVILGKIMSIGISCT